MRSKQNEQPRQFEQSRSLRKKLFYVLLSTVTATALISYGIASTQKQIIPMTGCYLMEPVVIPRHTSKISLWNMLQYPRLLPWMGAISRISGEVGVDPARMVGQMKAESSGNPLAANIGGDTGLFQFTEDTAKRLAESLKDNKEFQGLLTRNGKQGFQRDDLDQPEVSIWLMAVSIKEADNFFYNERASIASHYDGPAWVTLYLLIHNSEKEHPCAGYFDNLPESTKRFAKELTTPQSEGGFGLNPTNFYELKPITDEYIRRVLEVANAVRR